MLVWIVRSILLRRVIASDKASMICKRATGAVGLASKVVLSGVNGPIVEKHISLALAHKCEQGR